MEFASSGLSLPPSKVFLTTENKYFKQRELFLSEVNYREITAAIEQNNDKFYLQTRIEKFPLQQR